MKTITKRHKLKLQILIAILIGIKIFSQYPEEILHHLDVIYVTSLGIYYAIRFPILRLEFLIFCTIFFLILYVANIFYKKIKNPDKPF